MFFPIPELIIENLSGDLFIERQVRVQVIRLDKIHPIVSGNKLFKLHYFLKSVLKSSFNGMLTFGGAHSNHLVATSYLCMQAGLNSVGIVRGSDCAVLPHALQDCKSYGMKLKFISRNEYNSKEEGDFLAALKLEFGNYLIVPEGGYHPVGAKGAARITDLIESDVTHICCAIGTATTLSGLLLSAKKNQQVIGVPVLKGLNDLHKRVSFLTNNDMFFQQIQILDEYHFGGYAKKTPELIDFMNAFYQQHSIPTDFVYTGKMMFAVMNKIACGFFPKGSKIACIHTGGLQGNLSLPPNTLVFN